MGARHRHRRTLDLWISNRSFGAEPGGGATYRPSFKHLLEASGQKGTRLISQSNAAAAAAHKPGRHFFKEKLFFQIDGSK